MEKNAASKPAPSRKYEGKLLCLCLTAACLSALLNGLSPSLTLVASEFGYSAKERDIYLGESNISATVLSASHIVTACRKIQLLIMIWTSWM